MSAGGGRPLDAPRTAWTIRPPMATGCLVTVTDLQSEGLARLIEERGTFMVLRFLASGAQMTQEARLVSRYALLPGTRVQVQVGDAVQGAVITPTKLGRDAGSGLLRSEERRVG